MPLFTPPSKHVKLHKNKMLTQKFNLNSDDVTVTRTIFYLQSVFSLFLVNSGPVLLKVKYYSVLLFKKKKKLVWKAKSQQTFLLSARINILLKSLGFTRLLFRLY